MTGIMVLGHGHFASGIASAAELILGKQDDFVWVDFPEGDTKTELEAHIAEALQTMKEAEHILVFCDLLSGSPFNTIVPESMKDRRIKVVYGTNLAMLIETLMERNIGMSWEEILEGIIETGRKQVDFFNEEDLEGCEEENDEDWQ